VDHFGKRKSDAHSHDQFENLPHFRMIFAFRENEKTVFVSTLVERKIVVFKKLTKICKNNENSCKIFAKTKI
jgi:hypothetical protein